MSLLGERTGVCADSTYLRFVWCLEPELGSSCEVYEGTTQPRVVSECRCLCGGASVGCPPYIAADQSNGRIGDDQVLAGIEQQGTVLHDAKQERRLPYVDLLWLWSALHVAQPIAMARVPPSIGLDTVARNQSAPRTRATSGKVMPVYDLGNKQSYISLP